MMLRWRAAAACGVAVLLGSSLAAQDSPLFLAASRGEADAVERLLAGGTRPDVSGELRVGDAVFRVSALGAAALGWHADVARLLLERGASLPTYFVRNHNLAPASAQELAQLRDWEVVNSVLRTREVALVTRAIVDRDAAGVYRSHDGRELAARLEGTRLILTDADGRTLAFEHVSGKAFVQRLPSDNGLQPQGPREPPAPARNANELTMFARFVEPMEPSTQASITEQFRTRGATWLDFAIGEGRVLAFELREGGPGRLGGAPTLLRKVGARRESSVLLEREVERATSATPAETAPADIATRAALNWPSFRGVNASGVADGQMPPVSWDEERGTNIRWRVPIPGLGHSSPIVWGNRVYLTTAVSSQAAPEFKPGGLRGDNLATDRTEQEWQLIALDKNTGAIVWQRTAHKGVPRGGRHLKSSYATATPATDGSRIVAAFGSEGLYCFDMDGTLVWRKDMGQIGHAGYGFGSSPVIFQGMVIVQADTSREGAGGAAPASFIAAYELEDGRERWRVSRDEDGRSSFGSPIVHQSEGRSQIVTNGGTRIRAYDPSTGKELWSLAAPSDIVTPSPVASQELIYVMSGNTGSQPIFAIRPTASGDITLPAGTESSAAIAWSSTRGGSFTPTPIVYRGHLYSMNVSGILGCYDAATGARRYLHRVDHGGSGFSSSPVAADGRIYFASEDGEVFVVKAGPSFEVLARNTMSEVIMASPAISGGMLFVRTLGHLVAIG